MPGGFANFFSRSTRSLATAMALLSSSEEIGSSMQGYLTQASASAPSMVSSQIARKMRQMKIFSSPRDTLMFSSVVCPCGYRHRARQNPVLRFSNRHALFPSLSSWMCRCGFGFCHSCLALLFCFFGKGISVYGFIPLLWRGAQQGRGGHLYGLGGCRVFLVCAVVSSSREAHVKK